MKGARQLFIKTTRAGGFEYIKLVEAYREDGKSKHRVLFNFGRADFIRKDESFLRVVKRLCEVAEISITDNANTDPLAIFNSCDEAIFYNYGYLPYLKLWKGLGIERILHKQQKNSTKTSYSITETSFLMAVQHLLAPMSKLATYERQSRYWGLSEISLHNMYRALDRLSEWKEDIETGLFEHNYIRANQKVEVVFYDVTTFAFESIRDDGLKDFGFSKDCKFKEVQVVMGLIIDINGMPVGYELFPGNTFDGKTMAAALENIKKRFGIQRVIIVADRGLNAKINLDLIKEAGYGYIMASRIRGMGKAMKKKILSPDGFNTINDSNGAEVFKYKILPYTNIFVGDDHKKHFLEENLIINYSLKRAGKDKADRERLVEKASKLLNNPDQIKALNKRGGKKYLETIEPSQSQTWKLNQQKIEEDSIFDGYYGIQTSEKNMTAQEVMEAYHTLWKIEESFRIMKTTMEVRPIFHWTPKRIKGHFVLCFLAFLLERKLEWLLRDNKGDDLPASPGRIQEALNTMQLAGITANNEEIYIRVKAHPLANKIFKTLKINLPQNINKKDELNDHFRIPSDDEPYQQLVL